MTGRSSTGIVTLATVLVMSFASPAHAAPARSTRAQRPISAAPVDSSRGAWAQARARADDGHYEEALVLVRRGLASEPDNIDLLWLEAGITGWAGRHDEAVRRYERLVARHPELATELRTDLATERLWSGDPKGALRDLDARLEEEPGDTQARVLRALALSHADRLSESLAAYDTLIAETPADVSLRLERARVLTWAGRNAEAARAYRDALSRDPGNRGARLGVARLQNSAGLHRHAVTQLVPLMAQSDADPEVLKTLAFARYWSGDPKAARLALDAYLTQRPQDREALDLDRRLRVEARPSLALGYGRSDDTDALRIGTTTLQLRLPLGASNITTLGMQRDNVRDPGGTRDPLQFGGGLETIWSAEWVTHANASWLQFGDSAGTAGLSELAVIWRPEDRLRIDAGVSREPVMTRVALALGISTQTWVGGVDVRPAERWMLHADARQRFYSDSNRAQAEALSARAEAWTNRTTKVTLLLRAEQLRMRRDLDHGYYDPAQYLEWGPGAELEWNPRPDVTMSGAGATGWQRERGAETQPFVNASGRLEWRIESFATLALEGGRSNSNLQSASGYERRRWAVSISRGF